MTGPQHCEQYPAGVGCVTNEVAEQGIGTGVSIEHKPAASTLPFTGTDVAGLGLIGLGCALAGAFAVWRSHRRAARV